MTSRPAPPHGAGRELRRAAVRLGSVARAFMVVVVAAIVTMPLAATGLPLHPRAAAAATPAGQAAASSSPGADGAFAISLAELEPLVVQQGDTLTLAGSVRNTSAKTQTDVSIELRASSVRIGTRYDLGRDADPSTVVGVLYSSTRQRLGTLAAGASTSWVMTIAVSRLGLPTSASQFGAYPIAVEAASDDADARSRLPTTLMWVPKGSQFTPTQVSWVWPVVDGVHRGIGNTFSNDALAADLAPSGRMGALLQAAATAAVPLTYAIDPALVDDAVAMAASVTPPPSSPGAVTSGTPKPSATATTGTGTASATAGATAKPSPATRSPAPATSGSATPGPPAPYRVQTPTGIRAGAGAAVAAAWLTQLRSLATASTASVMALPYGDADLVALARAGLDKEIGIARSTGLSVLRQDVVTPGLDDATWPIGGVIDETTLDDLASDGVSVVVLSDTALPPRDPNAIGGPRTDVPTASGTVHAVLSDSALDALIADPTTVAGGTRAAEQRFLAETMVITEQRPGAGSSIVLTPPRTADPTTDPLLEKALQDTGSVPWLKGVGLGEIAAQPRDSIVRSPLQYPQDARAAELPSSVLAPIAGVRADLATFEAVLGPAPASATTPSVEQFLNAATLALTRAESSWWRATPTRPTQIIDTITSDLANERAQVYVINPHLVTLTSRKQRIPLTVVNNLDEPVTVQLQLVSANPKRLKSPTVPPFTIDGKGGRHDIVVEVEAPTSGQFEVRAQLLTPDARARPFGEPIVFEMHSTAYGAVALAIAGGAAAVLFLVGGIRLVRRIRKVRRDDAANAAAPDEPVATP